MKKTFKTKKILTVGLALGVLFSPNLITSEHKVSAAVDASTKSTVIKTFGNVYDLFLREPFSNWLSSFDAQSGYNSTLENIAYKAPEFRQGQFAISVFDFYKNQNFSKKIKLGYRDGRIEYKTVKHGEQLIIKESGVLVDLTPDKADKSKHEILFVTQSALNRGNVGVSTTNWQTFYLKKASQTSINFPMLLRFYPRENPGNFSFDSNKLYDALDPVKKSMATITTETIRDFYSSENANITYAEDAEFNGQISRGGRLENFLNTN
ncbi:hypothetical protein [Bacillus mycoides]|uniref:hypothetical protein n=1 Tax=Bacillus mycoides TaxID=1405 RepID=UPI0025A1AC93|nr:hypothetical protein [Bacillus mycoides]MDM5430997.1 hypothetical protein [Bacillus mycoides]